MTGKKSNELFQGGLSSIKYAATSVAKKLDEIKEAISNTPTKTNSMDGDDDSVIPNDDGPRTRRVSSDMDLWGRLSESRNSSYKNLMTLGENPTTSTQNLSSFPPIPDSLYKESGDVSHFLEISRAFNDVLLFYRSRITAKTMMFSSN